MYKSRAAKEVEVETSAPAQPTDAEENPASLDHIPMLTHVGSVSSASSGSSSSTAASEMAKAISDHGVAAEMRGKGKGKKTIKRPADENVSGTRKKPTMPKPMGAGVACPVNRCGHMVKALDELVSHFSQYHQEIVNGPTDDLQAANRILMAENRNYRGKLEVAKQERSVILREKQELSRLYRKLLLDYDNLESKVESLRGGVHGEPIVKTEVECL